MERPPKRPELHPSCAVIWNRLRYLQTLCPKTQGLLFVTGVDGKYNVGSNKAVNFCVLGFSGREVYQSIKDEFEDVRIAA